ncbi:MAG TPA: T9SS type A sorting domain-containing protein [Bacteroidota bacterium]|nr:T9SS type A sorting domain-containing protein [Bacteroidota bacterium]
MCFEPLLSQTVTSSGQSYASYEIDTNGKLHAWGFDQYLHPVFVLSQTAGSPIVQDSMPVTVAFPTGVTGWVAVATGKGHTLAIANDGNLYAWGVNNYGQLGNGTTLNDSVPTLVPKPAGVNSWNAIAAGSFFSYALCDDGNIYSWGFNSFGQLGNGANDGGNNATATHPTPTAIMKPASVSSWTAVAAGDNFGLAIANNDSLYSWGRNINGQLGQGNTNDYSVPTGVAFPSGVTGWTKVYGGAFYSMALGNDSNLYGSGSNGNGQLGDASTTQRTSFVLSAKPSGVTSWKSIVCGASFTLAIGSDDSLYAWGFNGTDELGSATGNSNNVAAVKVGLPSGIHATAVAAGHNHGFAVASNGYAYSWGRNNEGELGINSTSNSGTNTIVNVGKIFGLVPVAPETPALLSPANNASNQPTTLSLTWSKSPHAAGYQCQLSLDSTFATNLLVNDSTLTDTTKAAPTLGTSTTYFWRVRSYNNGVLSAFSSVNKFATVVQAPAVPSLIAPVTNAVNQPAKDTLKCSSASGASQYHWQVSTASNFASFVVNDSTTDTMRIVNLTGGTKYYWQVQAVNPGGTSAYAGPDSFTVMTAPSVSPALLSPANNATNQRADTLVFKWNRGSLASGYECQVSLGVSFSSVVATKDSTTDTTFTLTSLQNLQQYYWRVRSFNIGGTGPFSAIDSFTTIVAGPGRPRIISPTGVQNVPRKTTFQWNAALRATGYHLQVATDAGFTAVAFDSTVVDTTVQLSTPLAASTQYTWHVSAVNAGGASTYSLAGTFTTGTLLNVQNGTDLLPKEFTLNQNYPNPFNPSTRIDYSLPKAQFVTLKVYNVLGQEVATLVNGRQEAGYYQTEFRANGLVSGVYFYLLRTEEFSSVHKMLLLK